MIQFEIEIEFQIHIIIGGYEIVKIFGRGKREQRRRREKLESHKYLQGIDRYIKI